MNGNSRFRRYNKIYEQCWEEKMFQFLMGKTYSMCTHPPGRTFFGSPLALYMMHDVFFTTSLNFGRHNICQACRVFCSSSAPSPTFITRKTFMYFLYLICNWNELNRSINKPAICLKICKTCSYLMWI